MVFKVSQRLFSVNLILTLMNLLIEIFGQGKDLNITQMTVNSPFKAFFAGHPAPAGIQSKKSCLFWRQLQIHWLIPKYVIEV